MGRKMASKNGFIPLADYIAERTGVLSEKQIADYIDALSLNDAVIDSLMTVTDRTNTKLLTIQEYREHNHIVSGHATNFLRRNKLSDNGLQDLQGAQHDFAVKKLNERNKNLMNWFRRLIEGWK